LDMERITHWISLGAQTSERVASLIVQVQKAA
jgi:ribosomal protein S16